MGGVLIFALRAMGEELLPPKARRWLPWGAVLLAAAGSLTLLGRGRRVEEWSGRWVPLGNLILDWECPPCWGRWRGEGEEPKERAYLVVEKGGKLQILRQKKRPPKSEKNG